MSGAIRPLFFLMCALPAWLALQGTAVAERGSGAVLLAQANTASPADEETSQGKGKGRKKNKSQKKSENKSENKSKDAEGGQKASPAFDGAAPGKKQRSKNRKAPDEKTAAPPSARKSVKPAAKPATKAPPPVVETPASGPSKEKTSRGRFDSKPTPSPAIVPSGDANRKVAPDGPRDRKSGESVEPGFADRAAKGGVKVSPKREDVIRSYKPPPKPARSFEELRRGRKEKVMADGKYRVIEEADRRVIVKQDNRVFIRHDDADRFRRLAPGARTIRRSDGTATTFMTRRDGVRIYDVTDRHGRLLYRYRRLPGGREVILIDNRRYYRSNRDRTRDLLLGVGIGLVVGSAVALAAPDIRIPRDAYIVDYDRASDDDLYEAMIAPPIERLDRGYSLDEVRYAPYLRDRMRRVDLDIVTFDFGSWEVGPDQERALERMANAINRALDRNPDEIFMIEGHTDAVGSEEDNLTLSDRRAQAVAEILTTAYGVPPENLVTQGYGEEQLKIPTDGPERVNRRISFRRIGPLLSGRYEDAP